MTASDRGRGASPLLVVVCFPASVHSARWLDLLRRGPYRVVVFPSLLQAYCMEFGDMVPVRHAADAEVLAPGQIGVIDGTLALSIAASPHERQLGYQHPKTAVAVTDENAPSPDGLLQVLSWLRPDVLHSMELQHAGYLCLEARRRHGAAGFPRWLASSWGSDTLLYRKLPGHRERLEEMAQALDGFHADCTRDHALMAELGFRGRFFPAVAASGGVDLAHYPDPAQLPKPSQRHVIVVKGYHGWAGRGMDILLALHRIAPHVKGFQIRLANAGAAMARTALALRRDAGLDVVVDPYFPDQARAIERLAQARLVIGYGISDGTSTTLLEAMAVGTFCIQADTACGCEWVRMGIDGLEVPAHDVEKLAAAILRALTDDALVDGAVARNRREIEQRWTIERAAPLVAQGYRELMDDAERADHAGA
jgi:hypothetical protein